MSNQLRALEEDNRPSTLILFFSEQLTLMEAQAKTLLDKYSADQPVGVWAREQVGIGPVISAGLLAHINIEKAPTVGHIWRFAGLDPTQSWLGKRKAEILVKDLDNYTEEVVKLAAKEAGMKPETIWRMATEDKDGKPRKATQKTLVTAFAKRPWNADLKVLCWKIGESFMKVSGRENAFYGQMYRERKIYEVERDERGGNAETAARTLREKNFSDAATRKIYESGHLPPGRLNLRAQRWATKLFLSHWHHVAYVEAFGENPPKPYILTQEGGHAHYIAPPGYSETSK
jgi:hypothetical protein